MTEQTYISAINKACRLAFELWRLNPSGSAKKLKRIYRQVNRFSEKIVSPDAIEYAAQPPAPASKNGDGRI